MGGECRAYVSSPQGNIGLGISKTNNHREKRWVIYWDIHGIESDIQSASTSNIKFLVGGLEPWNFMTFHIFPYAGNVITPTDELHHFSEG
jgi:hypothetical protein